MSVLERRLQLLLDQGRYDRVSAEAKRSGRSVAAVIREAIDLRFAEEEADERRFAAMDRVLEMSRDVPDEPVESWADIKREMDADMEAYIDKKLGSS